MTIEDVIDFLSRHQPMPVDDFIDDKLIQEYEAVRLYLLEHQDVRVVPLLLGSFGAGMGHGVFQLMDEVFRMYSPDIVVPALDAVLAKEWPGRWWCLQIALDFPDRSLANHFKRLLSSANRDERFFAAANLEAVFEDTDKLVVQKALQAETDAEISELLANMLK